MPPSGIVPEAAAGCKDAGGGGAVTVTSPPAPSSVQNEAGTAGAGAGAAAAEDALSSQPGGTRKLTRSHSNGGDPASFGSSGGGCSSRPEEEGERASKRMRKDGAPSTAATPPPAGGVPEKSGAKRRRCSSGKDAREGSTRKRIAPTIQSSGGGRPQRAETPVLDSPAADVPPAATAVPAPTPTPDTSASRPFAFAFSKKVDVDASGEGPPTPPAPPPSPLGGGGDVAAAMSDDPEPESAGVCASIPPPGEAREAAVGGKDGVAAAVPTIGASPVISTPAASPPATKARPFAFAAAAPKDERGELLRAAGHTATPPRQLGLPVPGVESVGAAEGVVPPALPTPARNSVSASLSLSMSPEEVQAGYSEAWSSLPSCFWDESVLVGGGAGDDGGVKGGQSTAEGPVTRWLALPHAGPTLEGMTAVAATAPPPAFSSPAAAPAAPAAGAAAAAAAPVAAPFCEGHRGDGGKATGVGATAPPGAGSAVELSQHEVKQSRWASFCTAFAASRGSSSSSGAAATGVAPAAAAAAASSTRATEEARSLPTLIRLGRSMTKGVALVEKEHSEGKGTGSAAAAAVAAREEPQTAVAAGIAEASGAPASAPARALSVAGKSFGSFGAVPLAGAKGGGGNDTSATATLSGSRRKRAGGGRGSDGGATGGGDAGGGKEAAAATTLPRKRAKKKGRIAPVFVSSLPPDSFGSLARSFSSNRRA